MNHEFPSTKPLICSEGGIPYNHDEIDRLSRALRASEELKRGYFDEVDRQSLEIERLRAALKEGREWLSEAINTLADPHDACDFDNSEAKALLQTINDGLAHLRRVAQELDGINESRTWTRNE
jgi:hypothetical protein